MTNFEIEGKLLKKSIDRDDNASAVNCEFIIEIVEGDHPEYLVFELTPERCSMLERFEEGENIKIYFELKGELQKGIFKNKIHAINIRSAKIFKYQPEIISFELRNCPPSEYRELEMNCYRFVFEDPKHRNNFLPAFLVNPARVNAQKDLAFKCKGFGLSLFKEKEDAKAHYQEFQVKTKGNFAKLVGDHLATVSLEKEDGVGSKPEANNFTHFTFHEYEKADFSMKVRQIEKI